MATRFLILSTLLLAGCAGISPMKGMRQDESAEKPPVHDPFSIDLGYANWGLSLGNSPTWTGIRINFRDDRIDEINGLNVTLWAPGKVKGSEVNGIAIGLYGPAAENLTGISVGGIANSTEGDQIGIHAAGIANVATGDMLGVQVGGLATIADGDMVGLGASLIATVATDDMLGIHLGGLTTFSSGNMTGIHAGGLATVATGDMLGLNSALLFTVAMTGRLRGINLGGLAAISGKGICGISGALAGVVSGGDICGLTLAGLTVEAGEEGDAAALVREGIGGDEKAAEPPLQRESSLNGIAATLGRVKAHEINALTVAGLMNHAKRHNGFSVGVYNRVEEVQKGVTIGVFNSAETMDKFGFQLGLLNHVPTNPSWARWLPLFNTSF